MSPALADAINRLNGLMPAGYNSLDPLRQESISRATHALVESFCAAPEKDRWEARARLSRSAKLSMLGYAWQMAEDAVSCRDPGLIPDGLAALSIEDGEQDLRDTVVRMALLYRSAEKLGIDPGPMFARVAELACSPVTKGEMRTFPSRTPESRNFSPLYRELMTPEGFRYSTRPWPSRRIIWRERLRRFLGH